MLTWSSEISDVFQFNWSGILSVLDEKQGFECLALFFRPELTFQGFDLLGSQELASSKEFSRRPTNFSQPFQNLRRQPENWLSCSQQL